MGSAGSKPRKKPKHLPKVPKYEEPNTIPSPGSGSGGGGVGAGGNSRYGHSSDHHHPKEPSAAGRFFLKILGQKPKGEPHA
jgi:hypothetical protein